MARLCSQRMSGQRSSTIKESSMRRKSEKNTRNVRNKRKRWNKNWRYSFKTSEQGNRRRRRLRITMRHNWWQIWGRRRKMRLNLRMSSKTGRSNRSHSERSSWEKLSLRSESFSHRSKRVTSSQSSNFTDRWRWRRSDRDRNLKRGDRKSRECWQKIKNLFKTSMKERGRKSLMMSVPSTTSNLV